MMIDPDETLIVDWGFLSNLIQELTVNVLQHHWTTPTGADHLGLV